MDVTNDELVTHEGERSVTDLLAFEVDGDVSESVTGMLTIKLADQGGGLYECMECDSKNDASLLDVMLLGKEKKYVRMLK